jgi:hypothetical protein
VPQKNGPSVCWSLGPSCSGCRRSAVASVARRSHSARWRCSLLTTGPNFLRCRYLLSAIGLSWFQRAAKTGTDNAAQLSPAPDLPHRTGFPLSSPHFTVAYFGQCLQTLAATQKRQWPRRGPERVAGESRFCGLSCAGQSGPPYGRQPASLRRTLRYIMV